MATSARPVAAVRLGRSPDQRLGEGRYAWAFNQAMLQGLLATPVIQEGIVIPVGHERKADDLFVQYRFRILNKQSNRDSFSQYSPVHVIFRHRSGHLVVLTLGPRLAFGREEDGYGSTATYPNLDQWLDGSVQLLSTHVWSICEPVAFAKLDNPGRQWIWSEYPKVEAIVAVSQDVEYMIAEIRLWEGRLLRQYGGQDKVKVPTNRRLDGCEPRLIGYWKLGEGAGTRIGDSSNFGRHGTLTGGQWVAPENSGLTLDCALEDVQGVRKELRDRRSRGLDLERTRLRLEQQRKRLESHIQELKFEQQSLKAELPAKLEAIDKQLKAENDAYDAWRRDIADGGKVSLDTFNQALAKEIDDVTERLDKKRSPYRLQGLGLDVKLLPVQTGDKAGAQDYRVMFPDPDDPIGAGELSTLRLTFDTRPREKALVPIAVPDVRGYTELAALRKLREAGFRATVMDQAVEQPSDVGRVVAQIVEEDGVQGRVVRQITGGDVKANPNGVVAIFLGRASVTSGGGGAPSSVVR